jgi:hypothetical protein
MTSPLLMFEWLYGDGISGVIVELAHERADERCAPKRLSEWRWLVDPPGDRLEVADVEAKRPGVAVPTDDVERVVAVVIRRDPVGRADMDHEVALVGSRFGVLRRVKVALAVGRVLEQLAVVVSVPLGRFDLRRGLEIQDAVG